MGVDVAIEAIIAVAAAVVLIPLVALLVRRSWMARQPSMFPCGLRIDRDGSGHWSLGAARYNGEHLEWFAALSLGLRPRVRLRRSATAALASREAGGAEEIMVYSGQRIVRLTSTADVADGAVVELSMDPGSATGLLSWLEAAPPSTDRFRA